MLLHSVAILACALSIAAHAAASPTASLDDLDQRDGLMVGVDVDADVPDNVNLSQKRANDTLLSVDVDVSDILNDFTANVFSQ
ncbi:uncharacterized protein F5891DRAFT_1065828 [Suillus fuscotomentosus]|uniref:Uncharacterized protein n=1 Tax=Suillus fuscotomentosus TaxID=1912939 RepID=A0AAD4DUY9_9AGAM|nr:uncharacterized protein F5891DRAFT_1065828 [Suillus fuscotomentosus]KAG1893644.1 hypothetical protein F5891DRAFT_1065828 [Suillus fuscotomentosus]